MTAVDAGLIEAIRTGLRAASDPARAPQMQAYMKSAMPFLGVRVPDVRELVRELARERPFRTLDALRDTTLGLWRAAGHREERYAATALLHVPSARRLRAPSMLTTHRELIVTGAWWDHVDEVSHRVGELLAGWPHEVRPELLDWTRADDRWLRRAAIICQLGAKDATDLDLLEAAILANAADRDFFVRKAIGWALRDYARTDEGWVREFVAAHRDDLSPLSRREAGKHL